MFTHTLNFQLAAMIRSILMILFWVTAVPFFQLTAAQGPSPLEADQATPNTAHQTTLAEVPMRGEDAEAKIARMKGEAAEKAAKESEDQAGGEVNAETRTNQGPENLYGPPEGDNVRHSRTQEEVENSKPPEVNIPMLILFVCVVLCVLMLSWQAYEFFVEWQEARRREKERREREEMEKDLHQVEVFGAVKVV